jgi:hypothetical protein
MKKAILNGIFVSLFLFLFFGCATQNNKTSGKSGTGDWQDVKSRDSFVGKWEGFVIQTIPQNDENFMPQTSIEISVSFEYLNGSEEVNGYLKADLDRFLTDWSRMDKIRLAGLTKEDLWAILEGEFEKDEGIVIGGKYFITYDLSDRADTFLLSDAHAKFQINKAGNRLKLMFSDLVTFGLGYSGFDEIILSRK